MIDKAMLPVRPGDVIASGTATVTVTHVTPDDRGDDIVCYTLTAGPDANWLHFQLPAQEFERRIQAERGATLTRVDPGGVEG